ncbi:MAG TPA: ATP-binding domain-containing protein [Burkholderiaceae bacterium]|nr:ATP-binding domain-containing protein [Burkholderiaceae bacterium]
MAEVGTFHQICERRLHAEGETIDYSQPGVFDAMVGRAISLPVREEDKLDELIVDEGQDFDQSWVEPLLARLRNGGRVWWLEDPMQNLYERPDVVLPGWTTLRARTNYRNPRDIVAYLQKLTRPGQVPDAASPFAQSVEEPLVYRDGKTLIEATTRAITLALKAGFQRSEIAVVTFSGRERSSLLPFDQIGPHRIRKATGGYDLTGSPEYSEGDFLLETVYRFKGQSAPCVVFTEIDFDVWDERVERRLFVGMTRASLRLFLVASERAASLMIERLS